MQTGFQAGATSKSLLFRAFTTSTGAAKTDLVYNTSGLTCTYFTLNTLASGTVTLATLATPTTAYSSGGFVHIAGGLYRLDVPNAQIASGDYTAFVFANANQQQQAEKRALNSDTTSSAVLQRTRIFNFKIVRISIKNQFCLLKPI